MRHLSSVHVQRPSTCKIQLGKSWRGKNRVRTARLSLAAEAASAAVPDGVTSAVTAGVPGSGAVGEPGGVAIATGVGKLISITLPGLRGGSGAGGLGVLTIGVSTPGGCALRVLLPKPSPIPSGTAEVPP